MTLTASGGDEVESLTGGRLEGVWLEDGRLEGGVVSGRFEQDLWELDMQWPGSPPIEEVGSTGLYQQFKVPVVECRFSVRAATSLEVGDGSDPDFHLTWDAARGVLELGDVVIGCSEPNFELEATDRVVGYERLRNWRIGRVQSSSPWESE